MSKGTASFNYQDTQVLVTGGSNGIGYAIASAFADAGANVLITGTKAAPEAYDNDLSAFTYRQLEITDRESIIALAQSLSTLDILVNNAGSSLPDGQDEWEPEVFDKSVNINLLSAYHLSNACKDLLAASELAAGGCIINLASLTSFFAVEVVPGYGAAKAGLVQLTKTLGLSWAQHGIRANAIAAGMILTRMTEAMESMPEVNGAIMQRTPLKRWGLPEDIADAALYLASDKASFITGHTLMVDGGYSIVG